MKEMGIELNNPAMTKFVGYYTEHSHAASQKGLQMKDIYYVRQIPVFFDEKAQNYQPDLTKFTGMIEEDIKNGLVPFWVNGTLGTTGTCAYDPVDQMGAICQKYKLWLNVDAAYSGIAWLLPEYRRPGLDVIDSIIINGSKFFMVTNIGTLMFVRDKKQFQQSFAGQDDIEIYKNKYSEYDDVTDYKNWAIGFGRRMNSLKFFYIINHYGQEGLQNHVRCKVQLAQYFEQLVAASKLFKVFTRPEIAVVTFRVDFRQEVDQQLQNRIHQDIKKKLDEHTENGYITPNQIHNIYYLRLVVCNSNTTKAHIDKFWDYLVKCTQEVLESHKQDLAKK